MKNKVFKINCHNYDGDPLEGIEVIITCLGDHRHPKIYGMTDSNGLAILKTDPLSEEGDVLSEYSNWSNCNIFTYDSKKVYKSYQNELIDSDEINLTLNTYQII
jgi:hypothetical protein